MNTALEDALKNFYVEGMLSHMEAHPEDFEKLLKMAVENEDYSWRAAWLMFLSMEKNDKRINSEHVRNIIEGLASKKDGHQRELLKVLSNIEIGEEHESILFDQCATIWEKVDKKPSVRSTAFKVMIKIAQKYPELFHEIQFFAQSHYLDSLSPGIKQSVIKMIKK